MLKVLSNWEYEVGCDEAGRGCLSGPVVAAAVILGNDFDNEMICNSVFWWYDSDESLRNELGEDCDIDFDTIPELKVDPDEFSFDDLTYMIKTFTDGYSYHRYHGEIWESIDG